MLKRAGWTAAFIAGGMIFTSSAARAECNRSPGDDAVATGEGRAAKSAETTAKRRLGAERAAYLDALVKLRDCLGEDGVGSLKSVSVVDVRYFDSEPIVEVDVVGKTAGPSSFVVLASASPKTKDGASIQKVRLEATRAALTLARRSATEALDVFLPKSDKEGTLKKSFTALLSGCEATDVSYWDDGAVSVKVECSNEAKAERIERPAPEIQTRALIGDDVEEPVEDE